MAGHRFQFKLSYMLSLAILIAIAVAFLTNASLVTFIALVFGCGAFLQYNFVDSVSHRFGLEQWPGLSLLPF